MAEMIPITVAYGDGIGPEIMEAVLYILKEAEAQIRPESIEVGEKLYKKNYTSGIGSDAFESIARTRAILKGPITTPQGGGYKSLNVTIRKALSLYANIRPSVSYHPFIETLHPKLDLTIVRENEEDLYAGIEYRQTHNMYESIKLISRVGSEKIIRFAFEYALKNNKKKVTCFSKDNIMKFSDGIFHKVFDEISKEYPQIAHDHYIIDIGTARLATNPSIFEVIVTSNLYGDIISDVAAEISGSVGLAGSANIGRDYAMFEAVHGSAPLIAGQNVANPSGLLNAAVMMLVHLGHTKTAEVIDNAWKTTIEDGIHTKDVYNEQTSSKKVRTKEFAKEVVQRLGQTPKHLSIAKYDAEKSSKKSDLKVNQSVEETYIPLRNEEWAEKQAVSERSVHKVREHAQSRSLTHPPFVYQRYTIDTSEKKVLVGVDVFVHMNVNSAHDVAEKIGQIKLDTLKLTTISSKGLKLWPREDRFELLSDHWCCRFTAASLNKDVTHSHIVELLTRLSHNSIDFIKIECLYTFNGKEGYSLSQGE